MIKREFTCVVCPNGCSIWAKYTESNPRQLLEAKGFRCSKGEKWVKQEIENPLRTLSSSILVNNGDFLEASIRTTRPIPLEKIFDVMDEIRKIKAEAPLKIGDVVLKAPCGLETEIIVTKNILRAAKVKNEK